ncbi:uncharacterized protein LOC128551313 [Mercenaria mercenaria]|uniref:uncharacterized protein LOC128551313 n=1 Tax=Mercenaria mercenaria TaxID=6596 RepID=UPI00234F80A8|nr:uncharacterized protein LOC128551313 [Mercenaria mercenaria]
MNKIGLVFVVCVLLAEGIFAAGTCASSPDCQLFSNQDDGMVTLQDLSQKVAGQHWIMLYYTEFSDTQTFGKCNFRWNAADSEQNIRRELMCYNRQTNDCFDVGQIVTRRVDECSRGTENNATSIRMEGKFYSQDINQYFWYDNCCGYNEADECTLRYLDLLVSKNIYPDSLNGELDLQGLPWHHIAADLKNHFGMKFSDTRMKFAWKGPDCGFDGKIKTSSASRGELNVVAFVIMSMLTFMF